jgi:hypothetical protein
MVSRRRKAKAGGETPPPGSRREGRLGIFRASGASLAIVGLLSLFATASTRAQLGDDLQRQAQCELSAIGPTRSRLAIEWIHTACNRLSLETGLLDESNRRFHQCLVTYLSGVQNDAAASQIINSCRTAYPP